jgi:hypothetical protein
MSKDIHKLVLLKEIPKKLDVNDKIHRILAME